MQEQKPYKQKITKIFRWQRLKDLSESANLFSIFLLIRMTNK